MKSLGTLGGQYSEGYAINNKGQIAGGAATATGAWHAFITMAGKLKDIDKGPTSVSTGFGINDSGIVVGQANDQAFVYDGKKMKDLNSLIPQNLGWTLYVASGINDAGEIVGYGTRNGTTLHAFLLTPR